MKVSNFHANHVFDCYLSCQLLYSLNLALIKLRWNIKEEKKNSWKKSGKPKTWTKFYNPLFNSFSSFFILLLWYFCVCRHGRGRFMLTNFTTTTYTRGSYLVIMVKETKLNNNDKFQSIIVNHTCCKNNFKNSIVLSLEFVF